MPVRVLREGTSLGIVHRGDAHDRRILKHLVGVAQWAPRLGDDAMRLIVGALPGLLEEGYSSTWLTAGVTPVERISKSI